MARTVQVYPKALLVGSTWTLLVKVDDAGVTTRIEQADAGGVVSPVPLSVLKVVIDLSIGDTDTAQDVFDALAVDDIKPGPQTETVWGNWMELADNIISGLPGGFTDKDFTTAWAPNQTNSVRQDARKALVNGRGWTVLSVHQHEGDGSEIED